MCLCSISMRLKYNAITTWNEMLVNAAIWQLILILIPFVIIKSYFDNKTVCKFYRAAKTKQTKNKTKQKQKQNRMRMSKQSRSTFEAPLNSEMCEISFILNLSRMQVIGLSIVKWLSERTRHKIEWIESNTS